MSLKAFHVLFITFSTLLALFFGVWSLQAWRADGGASYLGLGIGSLVGAVALLVYGRYFLKKLKSISYL